MKPRKKNPTTADKDATGRLRLSFAMVAVVVVVSAIGAGAAWWMTSGKPAAVRDDGSRVVIMLPEAPAKPPASSEAKSAPPAAQVAASPAASPAPEPAPETAPETNKAEPPQAPAGSDGTVPEIPQPRAPGAVVAPSTARSAYSTLPMISKRTPLSRAPDPALLESGKIGALPRIGPDGRKPWQVYARPFDAPSDLPRIAVVVGGLGFSTSPTEAAIDRLPGGVTLAFDPYAKDLGAWVDKARAAGHEVLLSVPMEPLDFPLRDPGPKALMVALRAEQNIERLHYLLTRMTGYVGILSVMGSKFATSERSVRPILKDINSRGLLLVDSNVDGTSRMPDVGKDLHLPLVTVDRVVDEDPTRAGIDDSLTALEGIARKRGAAVALVSPTPVAFERLVHWLDGLAKRNLVLAPVSAVVGNQYKP